MGIEEAVLSQVSLWLGRGCALHQRDFAGGSSKSLSRPPGLWGAELRQLMVIRGWYSAFAPREGRGLFYAARRATAGLGCRKVPPVPCPGGSCLFWASALGTALLSSTAEATLPSAVQTDPPASAPTSKPSSSSPPRDSLTPGPGPSAAAPLRQPPAKVPATDTIGECSGQRGVVLCTPAT